MKWTEIEILAVLKEAWPGTLFHYFDFPAEGGDILLGIKSSKTSYL